MLGFYKRQPVCAQPQNLQPVQRGSTLLAEHHARLARIRSMVGVPAQHWRLLYETLFSAYAECVQRIPVPETSGNGAESGTVLRQALETVELALKIRRGFVLPPGKEPEIVADEQDVWTYAVAIAALLQGTGRLLLVQRVTLHDRDRPVGVWCPWTGPMTQSGITHYRVDLDRRTESGVAQWVLPLLVPHIVPDDGLRWLSGHEDALAACLATVSGHPDATVISEIIRKASRPSGADSVPDNAQLPAAQDPQRNLSGTEANSEIRTSQQQPPDAARPEALVAEGSVTDPDDPGAHEAESSSSIPSTVGQSEDPGEVFLQWLTNGIASGVLPVNTGKAHLHVVDAGLLLTSPAVFRAFGGENWREVQKRFLKRKLTVKAANGENVFHYWQTGDRGRTTIKGMLIRNAEQQLGVSLPTMNPQLVPKPDNR